eukprot:CCRYP_019607-RA/>CCRYP_019607-RA protein AED:0.19 eAED:-0.03 QI:0/0/0/1/0/0/2/0/206
MICYGVSGNAFLDYHQFGETTSRRCVHHLVRGLVTCPALAEVYLRKPTKADALNITTLHKKAHKMPGMLGSLDVTKVHWKNCPTALKGQFQCQEKCATIALEAVVDHNLWFWHGDGKDFNKLYYLVDGIYASLSRFLGPENDPTTQLDGSFKVDQEAARKDVERGYGVLKLKFLVLTHPITLHHRDDIYYLVMATILLHNMMVEER